MGRTKQEAEDTPTSARRRTTRNAEGAGTSRKAAMHDLGKKREQQQAERAQRASVVTAAASAAESSVLKYEDCGLTRAERKAMRKRGARALDSEEEESAEDELDLFSDEGEGEAEATALIAGPPAQLSDMERIRVGRQRLEQWQLEPFFERMLCGCLVRIGLQASLGGAGEAVKLYRVARVLGLEELGQPYTLGQRRTSKQLLLDFGESRQHYPMNVISNGPFEELELTSWQQVLQACDSPLISRPHLEKKERDLQQASSYVHSEEDVRRMVAQGQQQGQAPLTARQKLLQRHGGERVIQRAQQADLVSRPMKFQRNVLGQAVVVDHE